MRCGACRKHIRSDNGPEFVAATIRRWLDQVDVEALYIEPGSPWENGYAESFHSRLRDEFLTVEVFENLAAARTLTAAWREDYNHHRPHSSLGYRTPSEFAARVLLPLRLRLRSSSTREPKTKNLYPNPYLHNRWYRKSTLVTATSSAACRPR